MNRISTIIFSLAIAFAMASCGGDNKPQGADWGHTEYYEDFLFKEYEPVVMANTLEIELNNDAARFFNSDEASIELCVSSDPDKFVRPTDIIVYFNGKQCENFKFSIAPKAQIGKEDSELDEDYYTVSGELAIEFKDEALDGRHEYYVLYSDCSSKNTVRLRDSEQVIQVSKKDLTYTFEGSIVNGIFATKETIYNPAAVATFWTIVGIIAAIILWLFVSRCIIWRPTRFSKIYFDYNDGYGSNPVKTSGCYEVVCTSDANLKDSTSERILKGKRMYVVNDFWKDTVIIKDGSRRNSVIVSGARKYDIVGDRVRKEPFNMINEDGKKVTIEIS